MKTHEFKILPEYFKAQAEGKKNFEIRKNDKFYDGQIYDAYAFINDLLKSAKSEVLLVDNYIDDTVFTLFSKYNYQQIFIDLITFIYNKTLF